MAQPNTVPTLTLNNGVEIPQLGFGVFQIDPADTSAAVQQALSVGYRHIDTAQMYGNEAEVAAGIAESGVDPSTIFVTSKINNNSHGYDATRRSFAETLDKLRTEQIDLILIHWPLPTVGDFLGTWRALEQEYADGRARAIGVSNFQPGHLQKLFEESTVVPAVNQIEVHPYFAQTELREFDAKHGIATEGWSPIAQGDVLDDPVVGAIAKRIGKSPAQVVLRWHIQNGVIVFPKASSVERMTENFELFDFSLEPADMAEINALDRDGRRGPNPDTFDYVPD